MIKSLFLRKYSSLLFFLFFCCFGLTAQSTITTVDGRMVKTSELDAYLKNTIETLEIPGLSIAILNDSEMVYHQVFGVQQAGGTEPINQQSIFEGASLSKPIFAYFAMKMVDQGLLDLDKPLHDYLPHPAIVEASQEAYKRITPRMVLSHSTGFPNFSEGQPIELAFEPGTDFSYSGEAYQYLAAIIGQLNGVGWKDKFNAIFEEQVTAPLGMEHTSFLWNDYLAAHKVYGHNAENQPTDNGLGGWSGKTFNAFSSIHSEAAEYAKFISAMLKQEGLSEKAFVEMLATQNTFSDTNELRAETGQTGWGLGFAQKPSPHGLMHLHTGNNHDFQAYTMFIPDTGYGIVLFTNCGKLLELLDQLETVLGEQF
ncbi:MAG: serine hydrolase domain-containing protein [Bacteroidota bacterium]